MYKITENEPIDAGAMDNQTLQQGYTARRTVRQHYLDALPLKEDGVVDFSALTDNIGDRLVSPFQRLATLMNIEAELANISTELTGRGLEPAEPQSYINLESK